MLLITSLWSTIFLAQNNVTVSPNPFEDEITFTTTAQCGDSLVFAVYDRWGRFYIDLDTQKVVQDLTLSYNVSLPEGAYFALISIDSSKHLLQIVRTSDEKSATINLALSEVSCSDQPFEIFPNPSPEGTFKIRQVAIDRSYEVEIFDVSGKSVWQETVKDRSDDVHLMDLSDHPKGSYYIRIKSAGKEYSSNIILQ